MAFEVNPQAYSFGNPVQNFMQGLQAGMLPKQMQQEAQTNALQQQILQAQAQYAPQMTAADLQGKELQNQFLKTQNQYYPQSIAGKNDPKASGDVANAVYVENMAKQFGENDPRVIQARKALQAQYDQQKSMADYRNAYASSIDKRAATSLSKTQQELEDVNAGFMPGTGRTQPITPEQQKSMQGQYDLAIQKATSDLQTRQKVLYASNIDKTIASFNPEDLVQYSGLAGSFEKMKQQGLAPVGKESEAYDKYMNAKASAEMLATQVRQFYGDSIQPSMIARLESLTNPETWAKNPKLARQNLDQIQSILKKETQTYRDATQSTAPYKGTEIPNPEKISTKDQYHDKDVLTFEDGRSMTAAEARKQGLI